MTKNLIATNGHDPLVPTKSVTRDNAAEKIQQIKILHLEDLQSDALLVNQVLKKSKLKFETLVVDTKEKFADALADFAPDVVLADHFLPAFNSHEALVAFHDSGIDAPFILITAHISEEFAIDVINRGADDYILKDRLQRLPTAIQNLLEKFRLEKVQQVFVDELIKKEKHYRALVENGADAVVILNAEGKITYVSPSIERVLGYTEAEIMQLDLSSIVRPEDVAAGEIKIAESLSKPGVAINGHTARMLHKDGSWRWIEATIKNMLHDPDVNGIVDNFRDVTQRVLAEEKIIHANRLYNFISQINQTIVHTKDQQTLFNRVCRIAITLGKFKAAWIGIIDKTNQKVNLVEGFGLPEEDKDEYKNASYPNGGPLDHVLRTNRYFVCNDIPQDPDLHGWKPAAKNGYGSVMVLPIWKSGSIFGTFKLYAAEINFFNAAEIALLEEAAGDISFALDVFEKDRQKSAAEEKIIHNERKFRALIENSTDGLTVMTADGTVLDTSASSKKILGYDSKEIVGAFGLDRIHPDDLINVVGAFTQVIAHPSEIQTIEYRHKMPDGTYKWLEGSVNNLLEKPYLNAVVLNYRDITERKNSERQLLESEQEQRQLAEQLQWQRVKLVEAQRVAKVGSWETNLKDLTATWSGETYNIFETDKETFHPTHPSFLQFVRADDYAKVDNAFTASLTNTTINTIDHWIVTAKGNEKCVEERWMVLHDEQGIPERAVGTCQDITDRKKADLALSTSESNLQAIFENTSEGFILTDKQGIIKSFNRKSEKFIWLNTKQYVAVGSSIYDYIHESRKDNYKGVIERILAGETIQYDHAYERENGQTYWFNFTINPVYTNGAIDGVCITSGDITKRKSIELSLHHEESRMRDFFENAPEAIVILDMNNGATFTRFNNNAEGLFKYKPEEIYKKSPADVSPVHQPDGRRSDEKAMEYITAAMAGEKPVFEWTIQDALGKETICEVRLVKLSGTDENHILTSFIDISERKRAEQRVKESETFNKGVLASLHSHIAVIDKTGSVIAVNKAWEDFAKLNGVTALQRTSGGSNYFEVCKKAIAAGDAIAGLALDGIRSVLENKNESFELEYPCHSPNEQRWFVLHVTHFGSDGSKIVTSHENITERKKAEEQLRETSERLRIATEATQIGIWDLDVVNNVLKWDDAMYRIYGTKKENFAGAYEAWLASVHPDDLATSTHELESALKGEKKFDTEFRVVWPDKTVHYVKAVAAVQRDERGNAVRMVGTNLDITARKKAEQLIVQSESNLKAVIDNTDAMIYSVDRDMRYITFNQKLHDSLKYQFGFEVRPGDYANEFLDKFAPEQAREWTEIYKKAFDGEAIKFEREFVIESITTHTSFAIHPIWDQTRIIGASCYLLDITEKKQEQLHNERMSADLVQRNKNLEQFSYIVSHNLRAPAANIIGLSEALNDGALNDEHKKIFAKELQTSVHRLDEVIHDLNDIMQVKRDVSENKETVVFSKLVSNIEDSIADLIQTQHVKITTNFAAVNEMTTIKSYLYSVFYNLISNSIKYKKPGEAPRIEIRSEKQSNRIALYFKDHGTGIDLETNGDKVFGLYKRFHQNIEGKGMGLFMVKTQVETLGGTIQISSRPGEGAEFKIEF